MAQKITTHLVDDLTGDTIGGGGGRTVEFGFDGATYEIDLSNDNADKLREELSTYIAAARKTTLRRTRGATSSSSSRSSAEELAKIRTWAAENGYEVAARGRISQTVRDAYNAAN